jgi:hypothetical protein
MIRRFDGHSWGSTTRMVAGRLRDRFHQRSRRRLPAVCDAGLGWPQQRLTSIDVEDEASGDYAPAWSPDAGTIAYTAEIDENFETILIGAVSGLQGAPVSDPLSAGRPIRTSENNSTMEGKMGKTGIAVLTAVATIAVGGQSIARADSPADCQTKSKKKMNDYQAAQVNLTPVNSTIAAMGTFPGVYTTGHRVAPWEFKTYRIHGTITYAKFESDQDIHLIISDGKHTMILESPNPPCATGSRVLGQLKTVRTAVAKKFPIAAGGGVQKGISVPATVTGVAFFDSFHGQAGIAPNAIELHPLLSVSFG